MTCQTCGSPDQENFCPNCGEKKFDPHSLSLKHVAEESIEGFTHADHNFLRTLTTLLFRPGKMSVDYVNGRRVKYMKPLALFLVVNLIFFLLSTFNTFNQPLSTYVSYTPYTWFGTREIITDKLHSTGQTFAQLAMTFNASMTASSKSYIILLIPIYGVIFFLLMWKARRKFIEHLVFAAHFITFMLVLFQLNTFFLMFPMKWLFGDLWWKETGDLYWGIFSMLVLGSYLAIGFRRFYGTKRSWSLIAAIISSVLFAAVVTAYRMILFYKIILLTH